MKATPKKGKTPRSSALKSQEERTRESKDKIITAAFECLGRCGYQKSSMDEIARIAGCSRALPRYHFGSKENMILSLLDVAFEEWVSTIKNSTNDQMNSLEKLSNIVDGFFCSYKSPDRFKGQLILVFGAADPGNEILRKRVNKWNNQIMNELFNKILQPLSNEHKSFPYQPELLSEMVYALFRGLAFHWVTDSKTVDLQRITEELKRVITDFFSPYITESE